VVDPKRFPTKGHFFAYCGLIKHDKISGGHSYGKRKYIVEPPHISNLN